MAKSLRLTRFTSWRNLKKLSRELLGQLIAPYRDVIERDKITLPAADLEDQDFYEGWASVFSHPRQLPAELTEALIRIDEMSTNAAHENLMTQMELEHVQMELGEAPTAMEVAVQVHLNEPDYLRSKHAEEKLRKLRSFVHFLPASEVPQDQFSVPTDDQLIDLSDKLRPFFESKKKGRYVKTKHHAMDGEHWFIIVHGGTIEQTLEVQEEIRPGVLRYRPEADDVLVYNPGSHSVRVNASTLGERREYVKQFGQIFFGSENAFVLGEKYNFKPVALGRSVFDEVEVEGIERVILRELRVLRGWGQGAVVTVRAKDLFSVIEDGKFPIWPDTRIFKASFDFYFTGDGTRAQSVKIVDENTASMARACDNSLIESWFLDAGFINVVVTESTNDVEETGGGVENVGG